MTRKWTINGRFLTQPLTGVQRYAREIVLAMDRLIAEQHPLTLDLEVELVMPHIATGARTGEQLPGFQLERIPVRQVGRFGGHAWEQIILPSQVTSGLLSLCNTGPLLAKKQILCIHDINTRIYPQSYSRRFRWLQRYLVPMVAQRAVRVTTVSTYSAMEIIRSGIAPAERITIIPNGHEHALAWTPRHSDETRKAGGPNTIVVIGSPAPHKNVAMLLGLSPRLAAAGFRIALVGSLDQRVFQPIAGQIGFDNVIALGRLADNELAALLSSSLCLAFPSFVEGFGLPPLEAMALGCPVVVSNRASLPELCADAALYAPPDQPDAWMEAFKRLRADPTLRFKLAAAGRARAGEFRWSLSAQAYLREMALADGLGAAEDPS